MVGSFGVGVCSEKLEAPTRPYILYVDPDSENEQPNLMSAILEAYRYASPF
jgi:hypothetical protein